MIMDETDNIIVLTEDNGSENRFEFLDLIEYKGEEYIVLLPEDDSDEAGKVVILQVEDSEGDEERYIGVEDQDVLEQVFAVFKAKFKDEFEFVN